MQPRVQDGTCRRCDLLLWHDEAQQGPQLLQGVLQWGARNQEPVVGFEIHHGLVEERVVVLQPVRFVHANEGPVDVA